VRSAGAGRRRLFWRPIDSLEDSLLTESEVQRSFLSLFKTAEKVSAETFDRAEALLDELRLESPLRHRLTIELDELRNMYAAKA
jgi:hypothetical protein